MPKVTKLYEKSRKGLEHNLGGFFGKPKKKEIEPIVAPPRYGKPESPKPGKIKEVGSEARSAIERRKKALEEAMKD